MEERWLTASATSVANGRYPGRQMLLVDRHDVVASGVNVTSRANAMIRNACSFYLRSRPLLPREHEVQVLNRSSGCAFAKIIENRGQQDVPVFDVMKYA